MTWTIAFWCRNPNNKRRNPATKMQMAECNYCMDLRRLLMPLLYTMGA